MENRLCKLHNAPECSQQCHGRPTGLALGQRGSQISFLPPSLPAWESSGELLCRQKNPLTYLLGKSRAALEWRLMHSVVVMDQMEPGFTARCSAELWGAPREGNRRDVTLVLVCVSQPCPSACTHLVHRDSAPQFRLVPERCDRKLPRGEENAVKTKPVYTEDSGSHSVWKRCSLTTQQGWRDTLFFAVHRLDKYMCLHQGRMERKVHLEGGCLIASEVPSKCSVTLKFPQSPPFPLEWQKVTFPANAEWARFHHEWTWLWQAVCVTYPASFHLPDSLYAWNASSSASSSAVTGGTRDLWGSREHFLILPGCNFPAWLIVLLTVAKGNAKWAAKGSASNPGDE